MRWEICFNLSVLRMLSFALDLHWRRQRVRGSPAGRPALQAGAARAAEYAASGQPTTADGRWRQHTPLPADRDYGPVPYLTYVLYTPLYLAGPIITFQDYAWQLRQQAMPSWRMVRRDGAPASPAAHLADSAAAKLVHLTRAACRRCCATLPSSRPTGCA